MNVQLAFDSVGGARPDRSILFLHGILGRGNNLRTIAGRFVDARPEWVAILVDLRGHGDSPKATPGASLAAAARDVVDLATRVPKPVRAIAAHSFGGKVALEVLHSAELPSLEDVFVIDSAPGSRAPHRGGDSALAVLDILETLPPAFPSRTDFVDALVAAGLARPVALWLGSSVKKEGDGVHFALDLAEIRALMTDYFATDLWPVVENPPGTTRVHLIIGDRSDAYSTQDRERARQAAAASGGRVTVDVLPAGHWVHVDDPDGLLRCLVRL